MAGSFIELPIESMDPESDCPSRRELEAIVHEALPDERVDVLLPHLGVCPRCRSALDAISGTRSFRMELLDPPAKSETDLQATKEFLDELKREPSTATAAEREPEETDDELTFLLPSNTPDSLGKLGPYEIRKLIGRGGMGLVLRALDPELEREVAIKVLSPSRSTTKRARERFIQEARTAAGIHHENVLPVHAVNREGELPYFTMPLIEGLSLQEFLDRQNEPLPEAQIVSIAGQLARGLAAAHARNLIHRDIKPANVLLDDSASRVWLADFGLARALESSSGTAAGTLVGTPQFMAPEQLEDQPPDKRSDLFSLGAVLYYLATGNAPFAARSTPSTIRKVIDEHPPAASKLNPAVPAWLSDLIESLLAKEPAQRPESAQAVAEAIERHSIEARPPRRSPVPAWTLAAGFVTVLAVAILSVILWPRANPQAYRLVSNGKTYPTLSQAVEAAQDEDIIKLTKPYTQIENVVALGAKALTLMPESPGERTVLDFTPLPQPSDSTHGVYELPVIKTDSDLTLKQLVIMRKHVRRGHRTDSGLAPVIHSRGGQLRIQECRFESQQPSSAGYPLADILVSGVDACEITDSTFLHVNRGICLLLRNDRLIEGDSPAQVRLENNVVLGSTSVLAFEHEFPRETHLRLVSNVIAVRHPFIFRPGHAWAKLVANPVQENVFSILTDVRMSLIRVPKELKGIRENLEWQGMGNTIATLPPQATPQRLDHFAMVRVTGELPPGTGRPILTFRRWNNWSPSVSDPDLNLVALEQPFVMEDTTSLDKVDAAPLVDAIRRSTLAEDP